MMATGNARHAITGASSLTNFAAGYAGGTMAFHSLPPAELSDPAQACRGSTRRCGRCASGPKQRAGGL
jgi:hypothetical protein